MKDEVNKKLEVIIQAGLLPKKYRTIMQEYGNMCYEAGITNAYKYCTKEVEKLLENGK